MFLFGPVDIFNSSNMINYSNSLIDSTTLTATPAIIPAKNVVFDDNLTYDTVNNRIVAKEAGIFVFNVNIGINKAASGTPGEGDDGVRCAIVRDGITMCVAFSEFGNDGIVNSNFNFLNISFPMEMNIGTVAQIWASCSQTEVLQGPVRSYLTVNKIGE